MNTYSPRPSPDDDRGGLDDAGFLPPRRRTLKERIKRNMAGHASSAQAALGTSGTSSSSTTMPWSPALLATRSHSADPYSTTSTSTTAPEATRQRREAVLDAATALASLGVRSPAATTGSATSVAMSSFSSGRSSDPLSSGSHDGRAPMRLPPLIRPPPIFADASPVRRAAAPPPAPSMLPPQREAPGTEGGYEAFETERSVAPRNDVGDLPGGGSRPLASLIGSDVPLTFPQKLMEVLSDTDIASIVSWLPHGKGFVILQKRRFASEVMPRYFKHSKFTSFTRKLNRWGFARVARGPEMGAYYHKLFQRGNYLLCMQMHCQSNSKSSKSTKDNAGAAVDASSLSPTASPKHDDAASSSSPPQPLAQSLPDAPSTAMSPLALDATSSSTPLPRSSPSPAADPSSDMNIDDDAPSLKRISSRSSALSSTHHRSSDFSDNATAIGTSASPFVAAVGRPSPAAAARQGTLARFGQRGREQPHRNDFGSSSPNRDLFAVSDYINAISNDAPIFASAAGRPSTAAAAGHGGESAMIGPRHQEQQRQRGADDSGPFDRVFGLQQDILRGAHLTSRSFPMALDANLGRAGPTTQPPSSVPQQQQYPRQESLTMQMQYSSTQQQQHRQRSVRSQANIEQAIAVQKLLGVDTSSSRSHSLVIANAMRALESSNNLALATAPRGEGSHQVRSRDRSAMQAQLRRLEEQVTERTSALAAARQRVAAARAIDDGQAGGGSIESARGAAGTEDAGHAATLARMIRLDGELKAQRAVLAARGGAAGGKAAAGGKTRHDDPMSRRNVARLREIYSRSRRVDHSADESGNVQDSASGPSGVGEQRSGRKYVRRASAA